MKSWKEFKTDSFNSEIFEQSEKLNEEMKLLVLLSVALVLVIVLVFVIFSFVLLNFFDIWDVDTASVIFKGNTIELFLSRGDSVVGEGF